VARAPRTGVLYVNLGSPSAPTPAAVRAFLDEFLGDPLVVDVNPVLWWLVRKGIILPLRGRASAELYRNVWGPDGSPLTVLSKRFATALARELGAEVPLVLAMRYGTPSIEDGLRALVRDGCERIVLFTAFPQASRTTTGTVEREAERALARIAPDAERRPTLAIVPPYAADAGFVAAFAQSVRSALAAGPAPDHVVLSFHGLPERYVRYGDPYRDDCEATARALATELGLAPGDWTLAYQSRFGRERWLEPDTAVVVPALAPARKRVLVCAPSFTTDCLETLEELGLRLRAALEARGGELVLVPCLNDDLAWVKAAGALVRRALGAPVGAVVPG
jgi:ferrochelatase